MEAKDIEKEARVLVAVGDRALRPLLLAQLRLALPDVDFACVDSAEALKRTELSPFDMVLLGEGLGHRSVLATLSELIARRATAVVVLADQPTARLAEQAIRAGAMDCLPMSEDWLLAVTEVVRRRLAHLGERRAAGLVANHQWLRQQIRQLELRNAQLRELVALDPLTGLYNRRHLSDMLALLFAMAVRHNQDLACLMFDLDNFKRVNDELGHEEGDRLLILAARTLKQNMRGGDVAARYGGDEFVVLLPQVSAHQARHLAQRLCGLFEEVLQARDQSLSIRVTLSVGVASRQQAQVATGRELIAAADAALSEAKRHGKSAVTLASPQKGHTP